MKTKIAFVCVHNSCRSQMAEAVAKQDFSDLFEAYSAGTETKPEINQTAVQLIKEAYDININETQSSKLISGIPEVDIVITMGCNVDCPHLPNKHREDWGLDDPSGKPYDEFKETLALIQSKMADLKERIESGFISLD